MPNLKTRGGGLGFGGPWPGPGRPQSRRHAQRFSTDTSIGPSYTRTPPAQRDGNTTGIGTGATRTTPTVNYQSGDLIVIIGQTQNTTTVLSNPTFGNTPMVPIGQAINTGSVCFGHKWAGIAVGSGSAAASCTSSNSGENSIVSVYVVGNHEGIGNHLAEATLSNVSSTFTTSDKNSLIIGMHGDWDANTIPTTPTYVPSSPVVPSVRVASRVATAMTVYQLDWLNLPASYEARYGISNGTVTQPYTHLLIGVMGKNALVESSGSNFEGWGMPV